MEQRNNRLRLRINTRQIWPLIGVASITGKRQARWIVGAAVLFRHDVLQVKRDDGRGGLRQPAIFTSVPGPIANQFASSQVQLRQPVGKENAEPSPEVWKLRPPPQ